MIDTHRGVWLRLHLRSHVLRWGIEFRFLLDGHAILVLEGCTILLLDGHTTIGLGSSLSLCLLCALLRNVLLEAGLLLLRCLLGHRDLGFLGRGLVLLVLLLNGPRQSFASIPEVLRSMLVVRSDDVVAALVGELDWDALHQEDLRPVNRGALWLRVLDLGERNFVDSFAVHLQSADRVHLLSAGLQ